MDFEWQTDEQRDSPEEAAEVQQPPIEERRWLWLTLLVLVTLAGGFLLWREARQRVTEVEEAARAEVRAAHLLAQRALAEGDEELFINLLSGRDDAWLQAQRRKLEEGRSSVSPFTAALGLQEAGEAQVQEIEFDPELQEAVLTARQDYALTGGASLTETISLEHTYVYRRGAQGWLRSPPLEDFWGQEWRHDGEWLSISYYERDETVALRLGHELDQLIGGLCALPDLTCPQDLHLSLTLTGDPQSSASAIRLEDTPTTADDLVLPSPTLIGVPLNGAGYAALFSGYATPVVAAALAKVTGYDCCRGLPFFSAMIQKQLSRLGVAPWPVGPEQYEALLMQGVDTLTANRLLTARRMSAGENDTRRLQALSLVDFLEAELGAERLLTEGRSGYSLWLERFDNNPDRFAGDWLAFIQAQSRSGQMAQPPSAAGILQLSCTSAEGESFLLGYDLAGKAWSELIRIAPPASDSPGGFDAPTIIAVPGDYGYVIREAPSGPDSTGRFIWRPDLLQQPSELGEDEIVIHEWQQGAEGVTSTWVLRESPLPGFVVLVEYRFRESSVSSDMHATLVNLGSCSTSGCARSELPGIPTWSPDRQRTLLQGMTVAVDQTGSGNPQGQYLLYRGNDLGQNAEQVGRGFSPFWLDEVHYGYLRQAADGAGYELVIATVADDRLQVFPTTGSDQPQVIARTSTFWQALAGEDRPQALYLSNVQALKGQPPRLLVQVHTAPPGESGQSHIFLLELEGTDSVAALDLLFSSDQALIATPSPAGRWLLVREFGLTAPDATTYQVLDLEQGTRQNLGEGRNLLWSPDGYWLAQAHDDYVLLWSIADDYRTIVSGDLSGCVLAGWRDEQG